MLLAWEWCYCIDLGVVLLCWPGSCATSLLCWPGSGATVLAWATAHFWMPSNCFTTLKNKHLAISITFSFENLPVERPPGIGRRCRTWQVSPSIFKRDRTVSWFLLLLATVAHDLQRIKDGNVAVVAHGLEWMRDGYGHSSTWVTMDKGWSYGHSSTWIIMDKRWDKSRCSISENLPSSWKEVSFRLKQYWGHNCSNRKFSFWRYQWSYCNGPQGNCITAAFSRNTPLNTVNTANAAEQVY